MKSTICPKRATAACAGRQSVYLVKGIPMSGRDVGRASRVFFFGCGFPGASRNSITQRDCQMMLNGPNIQIVINLWQRDKIWRLGIGS